MSNGSVTLSRPQGGGASGANGSCKRRPMALADRRKYNRHRLPCRRVHHAMVLLGQSAR